MEINAAGQSDRINVAGTATLNGGTVRCCPVGQLGAQHHLHHPQRDRRRERHLRGVSTNFAFLTPSLTYDANNVYLILFQPSSAFAAGAQTANQYAVGTVLDQINAGATGDLNTVLNAMSVLSNTQGPAALDAISGQPYADFGT